MWRWLSARYFRADPRTLGAARIVVGLLLCADCLRHWAVARVFYSNDGVLPNHHLLLRPSNEFNLSLFNAFSTPGEVHVAFALSFACYFLFAIGWRARLFSVLSCLWVTSMDSRLVLVENGGYVVVNLVTFWLAFLPTGRRFSVDSLVRSWRERRETGVADLNARAAPEWLDAPHVSLGSFIVILNLAIVYVFNVANKYGDTWQAGTSVHYVLHLDRMVTGFAVLMREHLPLWALRAATWSTLLCEAMIAVLIAWPAQRLVARPLAMALMFGLHVMLGVMMRLGPFSWFMIGWSTLLLQRCHWQWLDAWYRRRVAPLTVLLPAGPLFLTLGRVLVRLDRCGRLGFAPTDEPRITVLRDATVWRGPAAYRQIARALPGGIFVAPGLALVGVFRLAARFTRDGAIERFLFGRARPPSPWPSIARSPSTTSTSSLSRWLFVPLRELALAYLLACAASELLIENASVPPFLKHPQPRLVKATLAYPRIYQGWGMFAPNPVRSDGIVAVDGWTIDGRRIDPFTGVAPDLDLSDARGLGLGQIQQDYFNRIRLDRYRVYHAPLINYLARWHELSGHPGDELVAVDVYWLRDECPAPGALRPTAAERVCLISWRRPGYVPPPGMPVPAPRCKEVSAEKND